MRKLYIIPGYRESTRARRYRALGNYALSKGYQVVYIDPNWKKSLSAQKFEAKKGDVIFGFSLGGVLAILSACQFPAKRVILASATTYLCIDDLRKHLPAVLIEDIQRLKGLRVRNVIRIYGEKEKKYFPKYIPKKMKIDRIVKGADHFLSKPYLESVFEYL